METADARATLVDLSEASAANGLTVTVPRRQVETALEEPEPVDLVLDITRRAAGDDAGEAGRIALAWDRDDLASLLARTDGEAVTMVFDEDAVRRMMDAEFEAHGIRETMAVLAVAVAAGGAAAAASAQPAEYTGIGVGGTIAATAPAPGADIEAARSAAAQPAAPTAAAGIEAARSAEPLAAAADTGSLASASGIEAVRAAEPLGASDTALAASGGIESVRTAEAAAVRAPAPSDGGIALSLPSPETTAALVGGFALLITGAAFVARSKRHELRLP